MITKLNEFISEKTTNIFNKYLYYIEAPGIRGVNINKVLNLVNDSETRYLFFKDPTIEDVDFLQKYLKSNKFNLIELYHGTSSDHNILDDGLLTTKLSTKKSMQSEIGYVYLSVFDSMAKTFGSFAYPKNDISVYKITVPVYFLEPDLDQLRNQRYYAGNNVNNTLAESALFGHGFRIKGNIPPYMIKML
jgi:hypothetical protein